MTRIRINKDGINIAQAGYSVDSGDRHLNFASKAVALKIHMKGFAAFGGAVSVGGPVPFDNRYRNTVVNFGKVFSVPPICFVTYTNWEKSFCMLPVRASVASAFVSGSFRYGFEPNFYQVTNSQLTVWTIASWPNIAAYWVMENTIS